MSQEIISKITKCVSNVTEVTLKEIKSKSREQNKVFARMLIAYISYSTYSISQTGIAEFLKVDQPSISHYIKTIIEEFKRNKKLTSQYQKTLFQLSQKQKKAPVKLIPKSVSNYIGFPELCEKEFGMMPVRELKFHPVRRWRFDFAFLNEKVAIEVEGGVWTSGRHTRGLGFVKDIEKYNTATSLGWSVIRTTPDLLFKKETLEIIKKTIEVKNF